MGVCYGWMRKHVPSIVLVVVNGLNAVGEVDGGRLEDGWLCNGWDGGRLEFGLVSSLSSVWRCLAGGANQDHQAQPRFWFWCGTVRLLRARRGLPWQGAHRQGLGLGQPEMAVSV